jgi:hypothetical protein
MLVGQVKPGEDEGRLDLADAATAETVDLVKLTAGMQAHHIADGAWGIEGRVVGAG